MGLRRSVCGLILLLLFPTIVWAGLITMQDTLRPTGDGIETDWLASGLGGDRWDRIDEVILNTSDDVHTTTVNHIYSFETMASCPADWIWVLYPDSVELVLVAKGTAGDAGNNRIAFGRSTAEEAVFGWCGDPDTADIGADVWDTIKVVYNTTDPCPDVNWTAYHLNDYEWGFKCVELKTGGLPVMKPMSVAQAYVVAYWTFSDSAEILTASAVLCSTWSVDDCDDLVECLSSQHCDDIRTNVKDEIHAWTIQEYSNPVDTKIDSVEMRLTGDAADNTKDSIVVFYVTESEGTCTPYGVDTIPDVYYGSYGGDERLVVWSTCPATGLAWIASDLTDPNKGFGVSNLHDSWILVSWMVHIVYYSEEAEAEEIGLVKIVDKGALLKIVDNLKLVEIVGLRDQ